MLKVIRSLLLKIVDDIDAGNSNITEGEAIEIVDNLRRFTDKEKRLSKYAACEYLNVSRATFDNYVSMRNDYVVYIHKNILNGKVYVGQTCNLSERWRNNGKNYFNSIKFYNAIKKYGWDNFTHEVVYSNLNKQAADKLEKELIHKYNSIEEGYNLKEGGSRGELSTKSLAKMSESLKRGYSEFPERREKIRNKALGRKMPKDTRCKISLNHSKSNLLKINDEVGSIRYWALKIGKAHSVLSYRLKVHGIDNLRKYIEQRIKLV